jgi:hypothetical protein
MTEVPKKVKSCKRLHVEWTTALTHKKGKAATIDENEVKLQILQHSNRKTEASLM